jgi:hypothetical protein
MALRIVQVRLRFVAALALIFLVVGRWDVLRNYWDRLTRGTPELAQAVSPDTEYWCPMCPGVVSDWPAKCPVCNMALVRRKKGEAVPLPDGVLARMQFSPYRVQLAGIRTSAVDYRPLAREVVAVGVVVRGPHVSGEVFAKDLPLLAEGQAAEVACEELPGRAPFPAKVRGVALREHEGLRCWLVALDVDDPHGELRPGLEVTARIKVPVADLAWVGRSLDEDWKDRTAVDLAAHAVFLPERTSPAAGVPPLLGAAVRRALRQGGRVLAVPESAVVDTGKEKVVYVEHAPGMFDAVAVTLGPRCGTFYPVLRGLAPGDRVATAGAFLIDAETRLNPTAASMYFGGSGRNKESPAPQDRVQRSAAKDDPVTAARAELSPADRRLVEAQEFCPVMPKNRLGCMGKPFKVLVKGRPVFLCCEGCRDAALADPDKTLATVKKMTKRRRDRSSAK